MKRIDIIKKFFIEERGHSEEEFEKISQNHARNFPSFHTHDLEEVTDPEAVLEGLRTVFKNCDDSPAIATMVCLAAQRENQRNT
jgi:hypothetical protein